MDQSESVQTESSTTTLDEHRSQPVSSRGSDRQPQLWRIFSAQHLDDHSLYHGGTAPCNGASLQGAPTEESNISEKVDETEGWEAGSLGDNIVEAREGVVSERDVEAPLEKIKSSKSIKNPHLVSPLRCRR